jgi:hypothetical protein
VAARAERIGVLLNAIKMGMAGEDRALSRSREVLGEWSLDQ